MLNLSLDTVRFIIDKAHEFQMLRADEVEDSLEERDPSYAELKTTIEDLEPDQQIGLVALIWLGRGDYGPEEWERALVDARASWNERTADYVIGMPLLADYLEEGLEQLNELAD